MKKRPTGPGGLPLRPPLPDETSTAVRARKAERVRRAERELARAGVDPQAIRRGSLRPSLAEVLTIAGRIAAGSGARHLALAAGRRRDTVAIVHALADALPELEPAAEQMVALWRRWMRERRLKKGEEERQPPRRRDAEEDTST